MIPSAYRLDLASLTTQGRPQPFSSGLILWFSSLDLRWAITITKKALPLATDRNRLRRQLNHHFYQHRHQLHPGQSFRIIIRRPPRPQLVEELCSLLCTVASN